MGIVRAEDLTKSYEEKEAVSSLNFSVRQGENFAIIGPNGAGKTTTMKMICGLIEKDSGSIKVFGNEVGEKKQEIKQRIGYMPEESAVYENMRVNEYLKFFGRMYDVESDLIDQRISDLRRKLDLNHESMNKKMGELSKGMKRKALIIRSLINDPDLLVYDEPASGLDTITAEFLLEFINDLDATMILTGHNLVHVEKMADRVLILDEGEKNAQGEVEEIVKKASRFKIETEKGQKTFEDLDKAKKFISEHREKVKDFKEDKKGLEEVFIDKFSE